MEASLLQLMEELVESMEQRDAADPDAPAWEAALRVQGLEEEIARRLSTPRTGVADGRPTAGASPLARRTAGRAPACRDRGQARRGRALAGTR